MVRVFEVAEFVHDDVFDQVGRNKYEQRVEGDGPGRRATAPAGLH